MVKINVDCGVEYKEGFLNIDGLGTKTPIGRWKPGTSFCDAHKFPKDNQAELVVMSRVFERTVEGDPLSVLLADVEESLKPGGVFNLIVGKHDDVQKMINNRQKPYQVFFGPDEYKYPWYIYNYSKEKIIEIVTEHGFQFVSDGNSNDFKDYPNYNLIFKKHIELAPRDYLKFPELPAGAQVLDIGPGRYPLPFATHYLDINDNSYQNMPKDIYKGERYIGSIEEKTTFADKQFDFVFASHVFEHLKEPRLAAQEIQRIGKSGIIVCPGLFKEFLFGYEEDDHIWDVSLNLAGNALQFKERDPQFVKTFTDADYQSAMARWFRTGRFDIRDRRYLRNWYRKNEAALDVVLYWENFIPIVMEIKLP